MVCDCNIVGGDTHMESVSFCPTLYIQCTKDTHSKWLLTDISQHTILFCFLSLKEPKYVRSLKAGHHFFSSYSQLSMTDVGTTIKWGPQLPSSQARWASSAIVWIVFPIAIQNSRDTCSYMYMYMYWPYNLPRPISSANIPFKRFLCMATSQSNPICWYSRNECFNKKGIFVLTSVVAKVIPFGWNCSATAATSENPASVWHTC